MKTRLAIALFAVLTLSLSAQPAHQAATYSHGVRVSTDAVQVPWRPDDGILLKRSAVRPDPPKRRPVRHASRPSPGPVRWRESPASSPPAQASPQYSGSIPDLIRSIFPSSQWSMALCVANRESRFDPRAYNPSGAAGIFQLMPIWYRGHWSFDPFNAWANVTHAEMLWEMSGWQPWGGSC